MFDIKLKEKSNKVSLKALPVKIQRSKNQQGGTMFWKKLLLLGYFSTFL